MCRSAEHFDHAQMPSPIVMVECLNIHVMFTVRDRTGTLRRLFINFVIGRQNINIVVQPTKGCN